ncbi:MAG: protein-glutamate O-methyltransferase CheR [Agarilytica sp.]
MNNAVKKDIRDFSEREFPMTDNDFQRIKELAFTITGITLSEHKRNMVYGRLSRRLRRLRVPNFASYCELLGQTGSEETTEFVNAITTNLTSFFREKHHFEYLKSTVIPRLIKTNAKSRRLRVWSAGCSTGEEPYSIAMTLASCIQLKNWDVKILATDLDSNVVEKAKTGVYSVERAEGIPDEYRRFLSIDKSKEHVKVKHSAADLITFKQLNLLHEWPMKGPFDVIFCRNVVIYFNADTQRILFDRYADILAEDAMLFIGHSESLHNITTRFRSCGRTIYQRSA